MNKFVEEKKMFIDSRKRVEELVKTFASDTPQVTPLWDITADSIEFNDINPEILKSGIDIYIATFDDVWNGIYKPEIYDKDTLWTDAHDKNNIAQVIEDWKNLKHLSPLFFVKHLDIEKALVADGKHRLTVARYMGCENIPFMVQSTTSNWIKVAIPSAKKIY